MKSLVLFLFLVLGVLGLAQNGKDNNRLWPPGVQVCDHGVKAPPEWPKVHHTTFVIPPSSTGWRPNQGIDHWINPFFFGFPNFFFPWGFQPQYQPGLPAGRPIPHFGQPQVPWPIQAHMGPPPGHWHIQQHLGPAPGPWHIQQHLGPPPGPWHIQQHFGPAFRPWAVQQHFGPTFRHWTVPAHIVPTPGPWPSQPRLGPPHRQWPVPPHVGRPSILRQWPEPGPTDIVPPYLSNFYIGDRNFYDE